MRPTVSEGFRETKTWRQYWIVVLSDCLLLFIQHDKYYAAFMFSVAKGHKDIYDMVKRSSYFAVAVFRGEVIPSGNKMVYTIPVRRTDISSGAISRRVGCNLSCQLCNVEPSNRIRHSTPCSVCRRVQAVALKRRSASPP